MTWRATYRGIVADPVLDSLDADELTPLWLDRIDDPDHRLWVFVRDETIRGYCRAGPITASTGEVFGLYVHPEEWGDGAGQALFRHALADLTARGLSRAVLWVVEANARARRFYEKEGFAFDGARGRPFYGAPQVRYSFALRAPT